MIPVKSEIYFANGKEYELNVYQVQENGEYRIYISRHDEAIGHLFTASQTIVKDAKLSGTEIIEELIDIAKGDIKRNEFGLY